MPGLFLAISNDLPLFFIRLKLMPLIPEGYATAIVGMGE
jgi:hypothetical protein